MGNQCGNAGNGVGMIGMPGMRGIRVRMRGITVILHENLRVCCFG